MREEVHCAIPDPALLGPREDEPAQVDRNGVHDTHDHESQAFIVTEDHGPVLPEVGLVQRGGSVDPPPCEDGSRLTGIR